MNLIDLYGDPCRGREQEYFVFTPQPAERPESGASLLLVSLRDRLKAQHPHDHIAIVAAGEASGRTGQHVLQFLEGHAHRNRFQFHFEVAFSPALSLLSVRGNYLVNGLFLHLGAREQQLMAVRAAASLNAELSPLKLTLEPASGELLLEHSSFIDAALADLKFKRNLVNLTFRITFILELLMRHRFLLLHFHGHPDPVPHELPALRMLPRAQQRIANIEAALREVCVESFKGQRVDPSAHRSELMRVSEQLSGQVQGALRALGAGEVGGRVGARFSEVGSEEYPKGELAGLATKQDEKFDFRVSLRVELKPESELGEQKEMGGHGVILPLVAKFRVLDEDHTRRHPHSEYHERLAKKVDRDQRRGSKVAAERGVIQALGAVSHPNLPTYFLQSTPRENSLLLLWEQNASVQRFLQRQPVSLYQRVLLVEQAAKGLLFLHRHRLAHCDFKPANLILCRRLLLRLIDFGEANTIGTLARPGRTFPYGAPEGIVRGRISGAMDVYSLGVTMYRCLFGSFVWGVQLQRLRRVEGREEVVPWLLPERFREAGEQRVAMALACLSLKCTNYEPKERPLLPWIITVLQECRRYLAEMHYR